MALNPEKLMKCLPRGSLVRARETCTYSAARRILAFEWALLQWHVPASYSGVFQPGRHLDTLRFRVRYVVATDTGVNQLARFLPSRLHDIALRVASLVD